MLPDTPPFDLRGHVALVTGANSGIGAATAAILSACGASVAVAYLRLNDPPDRARPMPTAAIAPAKARRSPPHTGWVTPDIRRFVDASPVHVHVAQAEEVARVIAYLASDEARLISGTIVRLR